MIIAKISRHCILKFGNFPVLWGYLGCGFMTFNFSDQITLCHLLPISMYKEF